jgi:ATP-binding cassette, subfamily B, bacterial
LIDIIIPSSDQGMFIQLLVLLAAIFAIIIAANNVRNLLQSKVSTDAARDLQFNALLHLRKLGFAYYEQYPVGETMSLLNQKVESAEQIFSRVFPEIVQQTLFLIAAAGMLLYQSLWLSLIIIPCFLGYYLFGPKVDRTISELSRQMADDRTQFDRKIYESVSGAREFRAFAAEDWDTECGIGNENGDIVHRVQFQNCLGKHCLK